MLVLLQKYANVKQPPLRSNPQPLLCLYPSPRPVFSLLFLWPSQWRSNQCGRTTEFDTDDTFDFREELLVWNGFARFEIGNLRV